ncbi:hypothetical protein niasHT_003327 [Heterodera trifolii]|uniref:BTB domain-containing protein n=1 Tax=Heterodera trifolii TaxID=157864 RepID=A0ABD2LXU7_9BILA
MVLMNSSDVFKAMFPFDSNNAKAANVSANCPVVEIPDVEAAAFKVMLNFIYADDLSELNGDNAMAVLYAAKKYIIPGLVDPCLQVPISELRNVFFAYAQTRLFYLENYANNCLAYIDQNVDSLLKSEKLLQIEQNLLCEIFARDQLQISGEFSIWKACRENDIECSAENRRAVLGPALFRIRFPLVSKMQFSVQIVPTGILTADEVIGVKNYHNHPNFYGISDGLLYPLQFPIDERIKTFGTLLMDIENVSKFAGESVGSCRYSDDTVYIKGLAWKILAQINRKNGSTDQKCLGFSLFCTASEKGQTWRCKCSATFRIVTEKNWAENSNGRICEHILDNHSNSAGFACFISFSELMDPSNGFYAKNEDKMTLTVHLNVKEAAKIDELYVNEYPFSMEIEKVSEFLREIIGSERKNEAKHSSDGFQFKLLAKINPKNGSTDQKCLGLYLLCTAEPEKYDEWRSYEYSATAIFTIFSQKSGMYNLVNDFEKSVEVQSGALKSNNKIGFDDFIPFSELLDPSKDYYDKEGDKVKLAIIFRSNPW